MNQKNILEKDTEKNYIYDMQANESMAQSERICSKILRFIFFFNKGFFFFFTLLIFLFIVYKGLLFLFVLKSSQW